MIRQLQHQTAVPGTRSRSRGKLSENKRIASENFIPPWQLVPGK